MLMAHITGTSFFLVLLLCSASLSNSTGTENVMKTSSESSNSNQDSANINMEVEKQMTKYQRGRKMGVFEAKKDSTETGKVIETELKPMGSSTKDVGEKDTRTKTALSKLPAQTGANQNLKPHSNDEVAMKLYYMINRDYHHNARRRGPINNALPLHNKKP